MSASKTIQQQDYEAGQAYGKIGICAGIIGALASILMGSWLPLLIVGFCVAIGLVVFGNKSSRK